MLLVFTANLFFQQFFDNFVLFIWLVASIVAGYFDYLFRLPTLIRPTLFIYNTLAGK
jgi:hypothetical protein